MYIKIRDNEVVPADCVCLNSSTDGGVAFIETASLDGEKNLKPRGADPETVNICNKLTKENLNVNT